jgi:hypothetical protein
MDSISYLGLTREAGISGEHDPRWHDWYRNFPWEDWPDGPSAVIARAILPRLRRWAIEASDPATRRERTHRVEATFPTDEQGWKRGVRAAALGVAAGLVREAARRRPVVAPLPPGQRMNLDHRRILATGGAAARQDQTPLDRLGADAA